MSDITDKERGLGNKERGVNRRALGESPDAGVGRAAGTSATGPMYWTTAEGRVYRIVLNGYKFDFHPSKGSAAARVEGRWTASSHDGTYEILRNAPGDFQMRLRIGSDPNHTENVNATFTVSGQSASIEGSLNGERQDPASKFGVTQKGRERYELVAGKNSLEWFPRD